MKQNNQTADFFGKSIFTYTRAMALDDGVLIDISETANEAGLKFPTAVTDTVWKRYIEWDQDDNARQTYQDLSGRLWDVVWMARCGIIGSRKGIGNQTLFELDCIPRDGETRTAQRTELKIHIGPGDTPEPVITIMLPNED